MASAVVGTILAPIVFLNIFAGWLAFAIAFGLMIIALALTDILWPLKIKRED
jgi:hypothetical protein